MITILKLISSDNTTRNVKWKDQFLLFIYDFKT